MAEWLGISPTTVNQIRKSYATDGLEAALYKADVIVFTMPVYWYSIPAQIKGVIDRIFSFVAGGKDIAGKAGVRVSGR